MPTGKTHVMTSEELRRNILSTYFTLRMGIVVLSIGLPIVLWAGGAWWGGIPTLADSMSAYYGANDGSMRNWFVGALWTIGWFLYLYKGFSTAENVLLNLAGIFAVSVAMIPCNCWDNHQGAGNKWHGFAAVSFFVCMALVCFFCAKDTVKLLPIDKRDGFRNQYRAITLALIASPFAAVIVSFWLQQLDQYKFFIEAFGVWVFGYYWLTKSREFRITAAEKRALRGELENVKGAGVVPAGSANPPGPPEN